MPCAFKFGEQLQLRTRCPHLLTDATVVLFGAKETVENHQGPGARHRFWGVMSSECQWDCFDCGRVPSQ